MDVPQVWEQLVAAFAGARRVTRGGRGFGAGALKVDGRIFAMVTPGGQLVFKLPAVRIRELLDNGEATAFASGGRTLKEWCVMTNLRASACLELADEALQFVRGKSRS